MLSRPIIQLNRYLVSICLALVLVASGSAAATTLTDHHGRAIRVEKPFVRIISLYGAHTENIYALNAEDQVIGVSVNDTYPARVDEKLRFSYHDDPEKFIAFKPDLVLIRPMIDNGYPNLVKKLEQYGIVVVSLQPEQVEDMYAYWLTLGTLTGHEKEAESLVAGFKNKVKWIEALTRKIHPKKRVYFESIHSRMKTFSSGAMAMFALKTAGGVNVAKDAVPSRNTNIANYSKERILAKASIIDVFLAQTGIMNSVSIKQIKNEPGFRIIKAVKENQIYLIDENIVSRPVPRLFEGIVTIGNILYPDIFSKED